MKVVIMAGGKGTRISSVASDIPKPMIKVEGIPVLEREIECLKNQGYDDIILTVSHLGNIIMDYFGDGSGNSPVTGCLMWISIVLLLFTGSMADWLRFLRTQTATPMTAD